MDKYDPNLIEAVMTQIYDLVDFDLKMLQKRAITDSEGDGKKAAVLFLDYINNYGIAAFKSAMETQHRNCKELGISLDKPFEDMIKDAFNGQFKDMGLSIRVGAIARLVGD